MLDHCKSRKERWDGVQSLIQRWLAERQELIVIYCSLCNIKDYHKDSALALHKLQLFCEVLVDYVSAGHFEVYDHLAKEAEEFDDDSARQLLQKHYPALTEFTQTALDFNDVYDTSEQSEKALGQLAERLSNLGEQLDERFRLEDQLIDALHNAHAGMLEES